MENKLSIVKETHKELPNNIEAEQSVIGSILVTNEIFDEVNTIISNINFHDAMHQKIFDAIENMIYKGMLANPITLKNYFENEKDELNLIHAIFLFFLLYYSLQQYLLLVFHQ